MDRLKLKSIVNEYVDGQEDLTETLEQICDMYYDGVGRVFAVALIVGLIIGIIFGVNI